MAVAALQDGVGWVPVLTGRSTQPEKTLLGSRKDWLPSPCLCLQEALLFYYHCFIFIDVAPALPSHSGSNQGVDDWLGIVSVW